MARENRRSSKFLRVCFGEGWVVPSQWCHDPFSQANAYMNLPAVCILAVVTAVLVIGIRESALFNTVMVLTKLGVVLFVIAIGVGYVNKANWTEIPVEARRQPQEHAIPGVAEDYVKDVEKKPAGKDRDDRIEQLKAEALATFNTHDLSTFRGWMTGHDLHVKRGIGVDPGEDDGARHWAQQKLREALQHRAPHVSADDFAFPR